MRMSQKQIGITFGDNTVYECGARLLAVLAYPVDDADESRRMAVHASLCRHALETQYLKDPADSNTSEVKLRHVFRDSEQAAREVRFVQKRLCERLVAGRMGVAFLQRTELGPLFRLPPKIKRLSINQMAAFVQDDAEQSDAQNVKRRYWDPSRPVIHIAAAAAVVGQEQTRAGIDLDFTQLLLRRELIEDIVRRAELFETLITGDPKFPVKADCLVQLRLV
jgi:hypothetical protein